MHTNYIDSILHKQISALTQDPFNNIVYPFESKYSIFIELFNKNIVQFSRKLEHGYLKGGSTEHSLKPHLNYSSAYF